MSAGCVGHTAAGGDPVRIGGAAPIGAGVTRVGTVGGGTATGAKSERNSQTALVLSDGDPPPAPGRRSKPLCEEREGFFYGFVSLWTASEKAVRHKLTMSGLLALCGFALLAQHAVTPDSSNVQGDHLVAGLLMLTTVVIVWLSIV
jgi:hypothetical protein